MKRRKRDRSKEEWRGPSIYSCSCFIQIAEELEAMNLWTKRNVSDYCGLHHRQYILLSLAERKAREDISCFTSHLLDFSSCFLFSITFLSKFLELFDFLK